MGMLNFKAAVKKCKYIKESRHYVTLRLPEPFSNFYSFVPIIGFSRPSLASKVIQTKSSRWYYDLRYLPLNIDFMNLVNNKRKYNTKSLT